jgi:NADPH:quinone reductase-like Zn-dependent oxidoreductase
MKARNGNMEGNPTMRAMARDRYGLPDVLELRQLARPEPGPGEVLVRVRASSVTIGDWLMLIGRPRIMRAAFGLLRPRARVLGREVGGVVVSVGADVTELRTGDEVYGEVDGGAHAEYVAAPERLLGRKPANLTFEEAAAVPIAGLTALQGLRDAGRMQPGHKVLVNGASGAVGTMAVQVAKALGAEVTAVCSGRNAELVRALGADHVIDYTRTDFTAGHERYDVIFDLAGSHGIRACRRVLTPKGVYVASTHRMRVLLSAAIVGLFARGRVTVFAQHQSRADLDTLSELIEAGRVRPVIDRRYTLADVPRAFAEQGAGHARGRKIIEVAS